MLRAPRYARRQPQEYADKLKRESASPLSGQVLPDLRVRKNFCCQFIRTAPDFD
jgi:hypothetical protein